MGSSVSAEPGAIAAPPTGDDMLAHIIERAAHAPDFDLDRLTKLLDIKERWDQAEALKAFAAAKVEFKRNPPVLLKNKHVQYGQTAYDHATHDEVTTKVSEALARHGFSHSWSIAQTDGKITVTCHLRHVSGCVESVAMSAANDQSGGKNSIQAVGSANSYLQRYTLLAVTGLSTADMPDDDGRGGGTETEKPDKPVDAFTALGDAAKRGSKPLADQWRELSNDVRKLIVTHYMDEWAALKLAALGVDRGRANA